MAEAMRAKRPAIRSLGAVFCGNSAIFAFSGLPVHCSGCDGASVTVLDVSGQDRSSGPYLDGVHHFPYMGKLCPWQRSGSLLGRRRKSFS